VVKVVFATIPLHIDAVAATLHILVMERLMQIFDEMQNELRGLHAPPRREISRESLGSIVGESSDDAAIVLAVAFKVNVARVRWIIVSVDEVVVLGKASPFGVANRISPSGYLCQVVILIITQKLLEMSLRSVLDEVAGDEGSCNVAETLILSLALLNPSVTVKLLTSPSCDTGREQ
jgi:hypothetical protein